MRPKFSSIAFTSLLAVGFGWGTLWVGSQGIKTAFNPSYIQPTRQVAQAVDASELSPATTTPPASVTPPEPERPDSLPRLMRGDEMFDRNARALAEKNAYDSVLAPGAPPL